MTRLPPDDEECLKPIIKQMQTKLASGALATSEILVSYLKIFLIRATRLKMAQDEQANQRVRSMYTGNTGAVENVDRGALPVKASTCGLCEDGGNESRGNLIRNAGLQIS
jgi:hypothetical protein